MTIYEKLIFPKNLHYVPFWIMAGIVLFLQQEIIARLFGETDLLILRILISFYVSVAAIFIINLKDLFVRVVGRLETILEFTPSSEIWMKKKIEELGTFNSMSIRIYVLLLAISLTATVLYLGVPYHSFIPNLDFLLTIQPFIILSAHLVYGVAALLKSLKEIVNLPLKTPFYVSKHPAVMLLASFYSRASVYALIIVVFLALCVWYNPYGLTPILVAWWLFTSTLPVILFLWTLNQVHILLLRIKQENIQRINNQIQNCIQELQNKPTKDGIEILEKFMSVQNMVEKLTEWPMSYQGTTTFLATFLFPVVNFGLSILNIF